MAAFIYFLFVNGSDQHFGYNVGFLVRDELEGVTIRPMNGVSVTRLILFNNNVCLIGCYIISLILYLMTARFLYLINIFFIYCLLKCTDYKGPMVGPYSHPSLYLD